MRIAGIILLAGAVFASATAGAQGPDIGVAAGPYGVPVSVQDDMGNWVAPIKVFSNSNVDVFIPDITISSWAMWHVRDFGQRDFAYQVEVYSYYYATRRTGRELLYFDTRSPDSVIVQSFMRGRQQKQLLRGSAQEQIERRITALVRAEVLRSRSNTR
jgi:hypothetical protein